MTEQPKRAADKIRESAHELFHAQGIRAVGVDEIVRHAGVTKPSLYRAFPSKDALAADFVTAWGEAAMARLEEAVAEHPGDARAGVLAWFKRLSEKADKKSYRGCSATNCAVEYPDRAHPGRAAAVAHKEALRERLKALCRDMGAKKPGQLGDALLLLAEGIFATGQVFDDDGPAGAARKAAAALIDAHEGKSDKDSYLRD